MLRKKKRERKAIVASAIVGVTVALMLMVFAVFEERIGHAISLAAFAATTAIIAFNPTKRVASPKTIFASYTMAATAGFVFSLFSLSVAVQATLAAVVTVLILATFNRMHPPAIGYGFGFILGGYGFMEFVLTFPALMGYFIALGVVVLVIEQIAILFGLTHRHSSAPTPRTHMEKIEHAVDKAVPYALVLLFVAILGEFMYSEELAAYTKYLRVLDAAIIILFVIDLSFKFRRARSSGRFIQEYWMDIIATIPFFVAFRLFQGMSRSFSFVARGTADIATDGARFARFLRPIARFPRFARLIKNIEDMS